MFGSLMPPQLIKSTKLVAAGLALVAAVVVSASMLRQVCRLAKVLAADFAFERFHARVCPLMHGQRTLLLESLATAFIFAFEWRLAGMCAYVLG